MASGDEGPFHGAWLEDALARGRVWVGGVQAWLGGALEGALVWLGVALVEGRGSGGNKEPAMGGDGMAENSNFKYFLNPNLSKYSIDLFCVIWMFAPD